MTNSTEFENWLAALPGLGYERHWIRRNLPALEQVYRETAGAPMAPCPPPPERRQRDRYEEL